MKDMLGDFTKPLQGSAFARMQAKILNLPSSESAAVHRSVLHVDKNNAIRDSRKDKEKDTGDTGDTNAPSGSNRSNATSVKWARGTREGNTGDEASK